MVLLNQQEYNLSSVVVVELARINFSIVVVVVVVELARI